MCKLPLYDCIPGHADSHLANSGLEMLNSSILQSHTLCHLPAGKKASLCLYPETFVTNLPNTLS